jgi:hypothetical protein
VYRPTWSTTDEIRFINGLGHHRDRRNLPSIEKKLALLHGYLEGCKLRSDWTGLDREEITRYAEHRLDYYSRLNHNPHPTEEN